VLAADSSLLCAYLTQDDKWRMYSSLSTINPDMLTAIIEKEDKWFYHHPGINPISIVRAGINNITNAKRTSGASTITMQLARMRKPAPRTYLNKLKEMFRALQYEWTYSKTEILELYLSYLPYGGNVEGVSAAAHIFLGRPPDKLSLSQSILLSVIPNRPNSLRLDRKGVAAQAARDKWIARFLENNLFDTNALAAALLEPIPHQRHQLIPQTPQFCYYLRQQYPREKEIRTTLSPSIQKQTQRLLANHGKRVKRLGVSNGAVLILDNQSQAVLAYCGSVDFYDDEAFGQVDGVRAIRSPGSALKPAAYALGFEAGLISPKMKLLDVPTNFYGFRPENYDLTFQGQVNVHEALSHSLNIPPVRLVKELGLDHFLDVLEKSGFKTVKRQRSGLGLSAVLGGCGVTLKELTTFYSTFARGGELYQPVFTQNQLNRARTGLDLFSEESAYLVLNILSDIERPDLPQSYIAATKLPRVAWKTGTSYGRRDAWAIGFSPRYTVGVWMGNFDGSSVPELSGSNTAVPLMLDIFNVIDYDTKAWFEQPPGVQEREVCAETGLPPSNQCRHKTKDLFIVDKSPLQACDLYQNVYVNADSSLQYCPVCLPESDYQQAAFPIYDPELSLWFEMNEIGVLVPPPHDPACEAKLSGDGPQILSPSPDFEYFIERNSDQELLLQAASAANVSTHYWYINDRYYAQTEAGEKLFYHPRPGKLSIICMDEKGRRTQTEVQVFYY